MWGLLERLRFWWGLVGQRRRIQWASLGWVGLEWNTGDLELDRVADRIGCGRVSIYGVVVGVAEADQTR